MVRSGDGGNNGPVSLLNCWAKWLKVACVSTLRDENILLRILFKILLFNCECSLKKKKCSVGLGYG